MTIEDSFCESQMMECRNSNIMTEVQLEELEKTKWFGGPRSHEAALTCVHCASGMNLSNRLPSLHNKSVRSFGSAFWASLCGSRHQACHNKSNGSKRGPAADFCTLKSHELFQSRSASHASDRKACLNLQHQNAGCQSCADISGVCFWILAPTWTLDFLSCCQSVEVESLKVCAVRSKNWTWSCFA